MKKNLLVLCLFILTGCSKGENMECTINGKKAIFTLKNGIVSAYVLDGKSKGRSEIDELNGTYFTSSKTNEEGKLVLKNYVSSIGGSCNE